MNYTARIEELRNLANNRPADPGTSTAEEIEEERKAILAAIDRYATVRTVHLNQLLRCMENEDAEKQWDAVVLDSRSSMKTTFGDALHEIRTPTIAGLNVTVIGTDLEDKFHDALAKTNAVGAASDYIARYKKEVTKKTEELRALWHNQYEQAKKIMVDEDKELEGLEEELKKAADKVAYANRSRLEKANDILLSDLKKLLPSQIGKLAEAVSYETAVIKEMNQTLANRRERYMNYFSRDHESLLVVFSDTRRDAKEFVEKYGYDKVTEMTGKARSALSDFLSAAKTNGQKADADAFVSEVLKKLDEQERNVKDVFNKFIKDNELEFFGAFGADIEEMLVGTAKLDNHYRAILALDLHNLASRWLDDSRKFFPVDLSEVDDATKELLQNQLRKSIEEYAKSAENLKAEAEESNFQKWILGTAQNLWKKIKG